MKYLSFAALLTPIFLIVGCSTSEAPAPPANSAARSSAKTTETATDLEAAPSEPTAEPSAAPNKAPDKAPDKAPPQEEGVEQKNVKLSVKDQATAGQVVVEAIATSRDGWVSIHKSKADGGIQVPESLGEARVDSGDNKDIVVDLWEAPAVGDKLWVLLHVDAGEHGQYEFPGKDVPVLKNGETMARSFTIKADKKAEEAE